MVEEELAMILNRGEMQEEDGGKVCELLSTMHNSYVHGAQLSSGLYDRLSAKGRKVFSTIIFIACLCLSHEWENKGCMDWDKRKEAAESFCYKNRKFFADSFRKNTGFGLEITGNSRYLVHDLSSSCRQEIKESGKAYLLGFLSKWAGVHSTLQQSIIGGYMQGILLKDGRISLIPPLDYEDVAFPFI